MKPRIVYWSITSALAGFLFGFDTVVISGTEQTIQQLWGLSAGMHGLAMGAALYGTVPGALFGGWPADKFGRKPTLLFIGVLYVLSAFGCAFANGVGMLFFARVIGGIGIGISTVAAPLYISEIAPSAYRGRLAGMFQFNIVFGIVIAFLSNAIIAKIGGEQAWRWMGGYFANRSCPHHESFAKIFPAATIKPAAPQHPVWRGCGEFTLNDEPYFNTYFGKDGNQPATNVTVLATSLLPPAAPKPEAVAWCVQRTDHGRGFAVVMPHFYRNWKLEDLRRFILNGIVWTAKLEVPSTGVQITLPALNTFAPVSVEPQPKPTPTPSLFKQSSQRQNSTTLTPNE